MFRTTLFSLLVFTSFNVSLGHSDEIIQALDNAKSAYQKQDYRSASDNINQAISGLADLIHQEVMKALPGDISGWQRSEPSSTARSQITFGPSKPNTFSVEVSYTQENSEANVTVSITNVPHIVQIAKASVQLLSNPFFAKMSEESNNPETMDEYSFGDYKGIKKTNPTSKSIEYSIFIDDTLVQIKGMNLDNMEGIENFIKAINIEQLKLYSTGQSS